MLDGNSLNLIVTGASGFIGHHFVEYLSGLAWQSESLGFRILCLDSMNRKGDSCRLHEVVDRLPPSLQANIGVMMHDMTTPASAVLRRKITSFFGGERANYLVNFASDSHVERSARDFRPCWENNTLLMGGTLELVHDLISEGYSDLKLMQISTDEVLGPCVGCDPFDESASYNPTNPYAASKAAQEMICMAASGTMRIPIGIIRTMNNFGERQNTEKFITKLIKKISRGETVQVHKSPEGIMGSRHYIHAKDFAAAIYFLMKKDIELTLLKAPSPYIVHVAGQREYSNLEIAEKVAGAMGRELKFEATVPHTSRPAYDQRYGLDSSKIRKLGWRGSSAPLEKRLKDLIEFTLANEHWLHTE